MAEQVRAFRATGSDPDGASVAAALAPRFTVQPEPPRRVARTWLDTFDWRLHRAGLRLESAEADGVSVLTLQLADGTQVSCPLPEPHWPATIEDLPDCPLRDRVAETIRPRALLPVAVAAGAVAVSRVLNRDQKTVARIVTERPDQGEPWLQVNPLRGYSADADRIIRQLADVAGLAPATTSAYAEALARASRTPENYRVSRAPALSPQLPAAVAIAAVLRGFADTMTENVPGVIDAIDIEFLHDFRVAVRRTRSVLKLAGDALPGDLADRFAPEFHWLGDLTTPVRDLDVYLFDLPHMAAGLTSADPGDLDPFRVFLGRRRTAERRRLVRGLRSRRFQKLITGWQAALSAVVEEHRPDGPSAADLDRQRVDRAFRRVCVHGERLNADSPAEAVHTLRKRCKELRYLLEIFAPLHERSAQRQLVAELKRLQDALGEFQDGEVQREAVRAFAGDMMDEGHAQAVTVLAMGELAAQLEARQMQARAELQDRLRPFLSRKNRARVGALSLSGAAA